MPFTCGRAVKNHRHSALTICALTVLATTALSAPAMASEFASAIALSSLNGATGFRLDGSDVQESGRSVASAGDVNGDGFDDVIIGAPRATLDGVYGVGVSYVVFGKPAGFTTAIDLSSLDGITGFRLDGIADADFSGRSVAAAGDVNGDGFADIVIGAHNGGEGGESYVVFGKPSGFAAAIDLAGLDGATGFRLVGLADSFSGYSVAPAGDVNGDGFADIVIGARNSSPNFVPGAGESYVVFGTASGFAPVIDLAGLNGATGFRIAGSTAGDISGHSVAGAGDVNGDGFSDIVIGAPGGDPYGDSYAGKSYVVFGKGSFEASVLLGSLNGSDGFRIDGIDAEDMSGQTVASAGDVNGDGFADIIIGASRGDPGGDTNSGESYLVFGKAIGFAPVVNLASLNGNNGFRLDGIDAFDYSGQSVASAGDVNGDGFDDILVGAWRADPDGVSHAGESYVVFGKARGFAASLDPGLLDGTNGFRLDGIDEQDYSGFSVASAGDVNGDGFADIVIGAIWARPHGALDAGESYVVFGRAPDGPRTRLGSAAGQYISGGRFGDTLLGLNGDDRLEGRVGGDRLDGGFGRDTASYAHAASGVAASLTYPAGNIGEAAGDRYNSIENLEGSRFTDRLAGNSLPNTLSGLAGNDILIGANGPDRLIGGLGLDVMSGGGGGDIFVFTAPSDSPPGPSRDRITSFNAGDAGTAVDRIDLRAIDANTGVPGNQAFTFIGTAPFTLNVKGQLRASSVGTGAIIEGDVNGDTVADLQIHLLRFTNLANLTSIDFIR